MIASGTGLHDDVVDNVALPQSASPHPLALRHISVARFCERLAFYSMRHWLIAYMLVLANRGQADSAALYQYYHWIVGAMAFVQVLGGLVIDLGYHRRKAVVWGGAMIAIGYFLLALDNAISTVLAAVFSLLGIALYSPATYGLLGSFYRGREEYLSAGLYYHGAFINLGAFVASLFIGFVAIRFNWQQGAMIAAIVMMAGHVYLLAIARVFSEKRLPRRKPHEKTAVQTGTPRHLVDPTSWQLSVALIGFALYCFAIQQGQNSANTWASVSPGSTEWSKLGSMATIVLSIFAAFFGSYLFTQQPQKGNILLGIGFLLVVPVGVLLPGVMQWVGNDVSSDLLTGLTVLSLMGLVAAEFLVTAPIYGKVLAAGGKFKHSLLGLLSALFYLPYFNVLFPTPFDGQSLSGSIFSVLSVVVLAFAGTWMIKQT